MARPNEDSLNDPKPSTSQVRSAITVGECETIIRELIQSFMLNSTPAPKDIWLPRFNPDIAGADPVVWCAAGDQLMEKNPLQDGALYSVLIRALEGSAAQWLKKIMVDELDITWPKFKELFTIRFGGNETATGALLKVMSEKPLKGENTGSFGLRLRCILKTRWQNLTMDEIINACVLARLTSEDERIEQIALAKDIKTEDEFRCEMRHFCNAWSMPSSSTSSANCEQRHDRSRSQIKCFYCGILGHKLSACRKRMRFNKQTSMQNPEKKKPDTSSYFKCHGEDHDAANCPLFQRKQNNSINVEKGIVEESRADSCMVEAGTSSHTGKSFPFCFDSGAKCSLIRESVALKFSGKRTTDIVVMRGIGNACIKCTSQILPVGLTLEIIFHVLVDNYLKYIRIGREILSQGFRLNITQNSLAICKTKIINVCNKTAEDEIDINEV